MSSVNSFETDMKKLRRKRKRKRTFKNLLLIFVVVIIAGAIYVTHDRWIVYFDGILERGEQLNEPFGEASLAEGNYPIDISKKTNTEIGRMQNGWTLFADTDFYVYDHDGNISFTAQANYSNPVISSCDKRTLIYDLGGYNFMVCSGKKQVFSKKLTNQILLGAVGEDGSVAIVTSTDKYNSYLTIYDRNGSEIFHWADGNMITAVSVDDSGKGCLVSSSYAMGGEYHSIVTRLDFSSTEVGMITDPVKALTFALGGCSDGGFWLLADDALYRFDAQGEVSFSYEFDFNLVSYSINKDACALVFESIGVNHTDVSIFSVGLDSPSRLTFDESINHIDVVDSIAYFNTDDTLYAVDRQGNILATAQLDDRYRSFTVVGDSVYLLGYQLIQRIDFVH